MVIEISDAMFARLTKLSRCSTCDEMDIYRPDYENGVDDGEIGLARTFLDEAVIVHD